MTKIYANISIDHQNRNSVLESRIVAAAQCNADAVVLNKTTPALVIPENKKYGSINSRWGTISYIDYARKSELTKDDAIHIDNLCYSIGIPLIWCVTDSQSAGFVKDYCNSDTIKIHSDAIDKTELGDFCRKNFKHVIYPHCQAEFLSLRYTHKQRFDYTVYYTPGAESILLETLNLKEIDKLNEQYETVGYESRFSGIFPCVATAYKGIDFIEKYLGDDTTTTDGVLTPSVFYDLYKNLEIMEKADGESSYT